MCCYQNKNNYTVTTRNTNSLIHDIDLSESNVIKSRTIKGAKTSFFVMTTGAIVLPIHVLSYVDSCAGPIVPALLATHVSTGVLGIIVCDAILDDVDADLAMGNKMRLN